jgi:hypothetical protein
MRLTTTALFAERPPKVIDPSAKPLYVLDLTDKPIGYATGNRQQVTRCPVCNRHGIALDARRFLHELRYYDHYGTAKLNTDGLACELPKPAAAARTAKRKL